jgi:hypothetical protein
MKTKKSRSVKVWVDAADFNDFGGWRLDTQFTHAMGSPCLIAPFFEGKPAKDAVATVGIPQSNTYVLWVRARNWIQDHAPGRFTVGVNNQVSDSVFGCAANTRWVWERGGTFRLQEGSCRIRLQDLTGWFSRCNAVVLCSDESWIPPDDLDSIRSERLAACGRPAATQEGGRYDFIVVGGGPGGFPAAIQSARMGLSTLLIHDRPVLGGNASSEIGVPFDGANARQPFARESGITEEIFWHVRHSGKTCDEIFRDMADTEKNLTVVLNRRVISAAAEGGSIHSLIARDVLSSADYEYSSDLFLDATGDGWVGYFAGAEYMFGREGTMEFGESLAPEHPDCITMSGCLMDPTGPPKIVERDQPVRFDTPEWVPRFSADFEEYRSIPNVAPFHWWLEHPGDLDDVQNGEECRDELIRIYAGYWDYMKNRWSRKGEAENYELNYIPHMNGRREGRRLVGDYILNQNDCIKGKSFPDNIAYAGWPIDLHHPKGIYSGKEGPFYANMDVPLVKIPYRCLYSKNISNLFMAGRNVSVTHVALGTVRVENQCAIMGQAAGLAAFLCRKYGKPPRGIYTDHLAELQQLCLRHDLYIPDVKNQDSLDLALSARASASSTDRWEPFSTQKGFPGGWAALEGCFRAVFFPLEGSVEMDNVYLRLRNESDQAKKLIMHVFEDDAPGVFSERSSICRTVGTINGQAETWVEFPVNRTFTMKYAWLYLEPEEKVYIQRMVSGKLDTYLAWKHKSSDRWTIPPRHQFYAYQTKKPVLQTASCEASNVINGYSRAIDATRYMWVSDPNQSFPQWIRLDWEAAKVFNTVCLTFDTDLNNPAINGKRSTKMSPRCVSDYDLQIYHTDSAEWQTVAAVRDNYLRRRTHLFDRTAASAFRLLVRNTIGDYSARVYEIRVYNDETV